MSANACGTCTLCCTIMKVTPSAPEPTKPARVTCQHCTAGGCAIYADRPEPCQTFQCWWLGSQRTKHSEKLRALCLPSSMRPDRTGVVLDMNSAGYIIAHCAQPGAWKREPMRAWLLQVAARTRVLLELEGGSFLLDPDGTTRPLVAIGIDPKTNERLYAVAGAL